MNCLWQALDVFWEAFVGDLSAIVGELSWNCRCIVGELSVRAGLGDFRGAIVGEMWVNCR